MASISPLHQTPKPRRPSIKPNASVVLVEFHCNYLTRGTETNGVQLKTVKEDNKGVNFLNKKNLKFDYIESYEPEVLKELKKYDIWRWGDDTIDIRY